METVAAYDALAPHYDVLVQARLPYLQKIEEIVIARILTRVQGAKDLLDVGAGDGARALCIARQANIPRVVMLEPSAGMRARSREPVEFWACAASEIPETAAQFDVITSLWNVLGHIDGFGQRLAALVRLRSLLRPGGAIFLDVNHRYNAAAYGWAATFLRMLHDWIIRSDANGDVIVSWLPQHRGPHAGISAGIRTRGHVFTQGELARLFRAARLEIKNRWIVNYATGAECKCPLLGNLLYELAPS